MASQDSSPPKPLRPVFFVIGSTGSGKSALAIKLAHTLDQMGFVDTTVINCDVMQFYTALPIATNKATLSEMEGVPHTFLGFLSCSDDVLHAPESPFGQGDACNKAEEISTRSTTTKRFDVNRFTERASAFVDSYFERNPRGAIIICGGTCYYAEALMLANSLTPTDTTAAEVNTESFLSDAGDEQLWDELNRIDPVVAQRYHPNDTRRLRRLLEIHETTGKLPSDVFAAKQIQLRYGCGRTFLIWASLGSDVLFPSLDRRVDSMVERGLMQEVHQFYKSTKENKPMTAIAEAIGYREYEMTLSEDGDPDKVQKLFIEKVKSDTRRYARQQTRWIKNRFVRFLAQAGLSPCHFAKVNTALQMAPLIKQLASAFCEEHLVNSSVAGVSYPLENATANLAAVTQEHCDICELTVCGRDQMANHLKSKRHRGAVKRLATKRSFEETFGRPLPPSKKSKPS